MKSGHGAPLDLETCRSPCGERGLKCYFSVRVRQKSKSLPVRGAWIEIPCAAGADHPKHRSLPVRGAWIEIRTAALHAAIAASLPVRGAWIEMLFGGCCHRPPAGRSPCGERGLKSPLVRRSPCGERGLKYRQAGYPRPAAASLPVRGAWIEISAFWYWSTATFCRSPCGERGLKSFAAALVRRRPSSLPVRGAWIEM